MKQRFPESVRFRTDDPLADRQIGPTGSDMHAAGHTGAGRATPTEGAQVMLNAESFDAWSQPLDAGKQNNVIDLIIGRPRGTGDPLGLDDLVSLPNDAPPPCPDVAIDDWDVLCGAVQVRLTQLVGGAAPMEPLSIPDGTATQHLRVAVMDCVAALAQLRESLAHELARQRAVELQLFETRAALEQARTRMAGMRAAERQAWHRALHDSLTALPNRTCFRARLERDLADADPEREALTVMYLDLDGFKHVNDTYGHAIGDEMLRIVAARLTGALRGDDFVGRLGGDEFACLLSMVPPCATRLDQLARELFDAVSAPFQLGELQLTVRPSIGIAVWPADGTTSDVLLRHADAAMYRAKRARTGHAFFDGHDEAVAGPTSRARSTA